jgi:hypothetical protein
MGNVSNINHFVHFVLGALSSKFNGIIPLFLIYQLVDGYKFKYKVQRTGKSTDDIPFDLLFFALGEICTRLV